MNKKLLKKTKKNKKNIVKIVYRVILCITLKERHTKRFVQHWHSSKSPVAEWSWFLIFFFYRICIYFFICYSYYNIQRMYGHCLYLQKLCTLYLQCFQVLRYLFNIFKLNNGIYIYAGCG